MPTSRYNPNVA